MEINYRWCWLFLQLAKNSLDQKDLHIQAQICEFMLKSDIPGSLQTMILA